MAAIAAGIAAAGVQQMLNDRAASQSYEREKKLMALQNRMNMANVVSTPTAQAEGLRMAGFNPALVSGAGTAAAPTVSKGSADMPQTADLTGIAQMTLMDAQRENIQANTDKVKEEERGTKQANDITDAANSAAATTYVQSVDREIRDLQAELDKPGTKEDRKAEIESRIADLEASKAKVQDPDFVGALGIAQGLKSGAEGVKANMDALNNYLTGKIDRNVAAKRLATPGVIDAIAKMPREQWRELSAKIDNIKQLTAESESKEELNDKQVEKLTAEIESIGNQILLARLNDENFLRTMAKEAETPEERKAWEGRLDNLTDTEFRKLKYDVGAGVIKGVATGGALGGVGSLANKVLNGKGSSSLNGNIDYQQRKDQIDAQKFRGLHGNGFRRFNSNPEGFPDMRPADQQIGESYWKF